MDNNLILVLDRSSHVSPGELAKILYRASDIAARRDNPVLARGLYRLAKYHRKPLATVDEHYTWRMLNDPYKMGVDTEDVRYAHLLPMLPTQITQSSPIWVMSSALSPEITQPSFAGIILQMAKLYGTHGTHAAAAFRWLFLPTEKNGVLSRELRALLESRKKTDPKDLVPLFQQLSDLVEEQLGMEVATGFRLMSKYVRKPAALGMRGYRWQIREDIIANLTRGARRRNQHVLPFLPNMRDLTHDFYSGGPDPEKVICYHSFADAWLEMAALYGKDADAAASAFQRMFAY